MDLSTKEFSEHDLKKKLSLPSFSVIGVWLRVSAPLRHLEVKRLNNNTTFVPKRWTMTSATWPKVPTPGFSWPGLMHALRIHELVSRTAMSPTSLLRFPRLQTHLTDIWVPSSEPALITLPDSPCRSFLRMMSDDFKTTLRVAEDDHILRFLIAVYMVRLSGIWVSQSGHNKHETLMRKANRTRSIAGRSAQPWPSLQYMSYRSYWASAQLLLKVVTVSINSLGVVDRLTKGPMKQLALKGTLLLCSSWTDFCVVSAILYSNTGTSI